jgi:hypothetical protein
MFDARCPKLNGWDHPLFVDRCLVASRQRAFGIGRWMFGIALVLLTSGAAPHAQSSAPAAAQQSEQLLDRVVARVGTTAITLIDVLAAIGLGLVDAPPGPDQQHVAMEQLIDRQLILGEVARFPPPEPPQSAVDAQIAMLKATAGSHLSSILETTGLDDGQLGELARDSVRIQAYLTQRFGSTTQVSDAEVRDYFRDHATEFTRNGTPLTFEDAAPVARERAAEDRRRTTIAKWLSDLRARAEIIETPLTPP